MEVITSRYEFAHGKRPKGYGGWAFHPNFNVDVFDSTIFWFTGSYGEAKRAAVKHFRKNGVRAIYVLS